MVDIVKMDEDIPDGPLAEHESGREIIASCLAPDTEILAGIQKLQGRANYSVWKFQMKNLLNYEDLWEPIAGYPEGDETDEATKAYKDTKALARINLMLGIPCIGHTMRAKSAAEAWQTLENVFEEKGRIQLFHKLFSLQQKDYPTVEDYINQATWLSEVLAETGNAVDPEILGVILLRGLSPQDYETYKPLILETESSGQTVTSDLVISWLMLDYSESDNGEYEEIVEEKQGFGRWISEKTTIIAQRVIKTISFTSRAQAIRESAINRRNRRKVCFRCREPGHVASQCLNSRRYDVASNNQNLTKEIVSIVAESVFVKGAMAMGGAVGGAIGTAAVLLKRVFRRRP